MSEENALPMGWVGTTLGEVCSKPQYGWTTKANPSSGSVKLLRTTDISGGSIAWNTVPYCTDIPEDLDFYKLVEGDIVISRAGSVGLSYLLSFVPIETVFASYLIRFRPCEQVEPRYIAYYLQTPNYWASIHELSSGIALANVNARKLEVIGLPLAPLPEQQRIVAVIEEQFTRLDAVTASLQQNKARLKRARASVLKSAVEGTLTEEWRAEHPMTETATELLARILNERHAKWEAEQLAKMQTRGVTPKDDKWKASYKEPVPPDTEGLPELPEGWCWATVEQIAQIQGGLQKQPSRAPRKNAFPYLRVANVFRGRLDLSTVEEMELFGNELSTLRLKAGDLLIVEGNGSRTEIGRSALWHGEIKNCVHQNHIIRVRLNYVQPEYVDYYWNSLEGNKRVMDVAASTSGLYTLSVGKISRLPVPLPPLTEQQQIVAEVERRLSIINQAEAGVEASLKRVERVRQSILRMAFAGQLVPQDPNDEPASVLLERIKEECKQREQEEQQRRKEERMTKPRDVKKKTSKERLPLQQVLREAKRPLSPDDLFKQAGLQQDEIEDIEEFYKELQEAVGKQIRMVPAKEHSASALLEAIDE